MTDPKARVRIVGENELGTAFKGALRDADGFSKKLSGTFKTAFSALAVGGIGTAIGSAVKQAVARADELGTLAQAFGTTAEEISRLEYVASQTNTTLQQITTGLTGLQKRMSEAAAGTGEARKAIADLGVEASYLTQLPLNRQLEVLADAFGKIKAPADQVRIASKLFGDEVGRRMLPILQRGSEGLREMARESDALGNTLTTQTVEKLQQVDAESKRLAATFAGLKTELAVGLSPALSTLAGWLTQTAAGARNFWEALLGPTDPVAQLRERLDELAEARQKWLEIQRGAGRGPLFGDLASQAARELATIESEMNRVNAQLQQWQRDIEAGQANPFKPLAVDARAAGEAAESASQKFRDAAREAFQFKAELMNRYPKPFESATDEGNAAAIEDYFKKVEDQNLQLQTTFIETSEFMRSVYDESARDMFGTFKNLFFDPMGDGLDDLGRNIVNVFRNALANQATKAFFGLIAGAFGGSVLGNLFGAGGSGSGGFFKAEGGPVSSGRPYIVGERGPELFVPGSSGAIVPNGKLGGAPVVNITTHIDARGATQDGIALLLPFIRQNNEALEAKIVSGLRRGAYAR